MTLVLARTSRAAGGADNRYCLPGNVPNFGATQDGPALLPQACFYTGMDATPSPGTLTPIPLNADQKTIQNALNNARCGDIIEIPTGSSLLTFGPFTFPAKNCDDNHWITVRTSGYASLPPEGTRVNPCYAGIASLPGRPAFTCPSTQNLMFQIAIQGTALTMSGDHYRLIGLEITRNTPKLVDELMETVKFFF